MEEFMRQLEFLIQDIPDTDKEEALQYYRDYLEEAGPEREAEVLEEFGSPERVAAMIRADLNGSLEQGGEFTDHGYEDERFRDPNYQVIKRYDLPEKREASGEHGDAGNVGQTAYEDAGYTHTENTTEYGQNGKQNGKTDRKTRLFARHSVGWWVLVGLLVAVTSPLWLGALDLIMGIAGIGIGIVAGVAVALIGGLLLLALCTVGGIIGCVVAVVLGVVNLLVHPMNGLLFIGGGILALGLGLMCLVLAILFYGRFLPWVLRGIVNILGRLVHRKRRA